LDDVTAIAVHPNGNYVVTGEIGPKPLIQLWNGKTQKLIKKAKRTLLKKGISCLAFSPSGTKIVACAIDNNH